MSTTTQERFNAAIEAAEAGGVHLRVNVMECCRGCIGHEKLGLDTPEELKATPYAYHYGGQDNELVWRNGDPYSVEEPWEDEDADDDIRGGRKHRDEHRLETIFFNHGGPNLLAATTLAECFRMQGFRVSWNGTEHNCVQVHV